MGRRSGLAVAALVAAVAVPAMSSERPSYTVEVEEASFELRRYQPYLVASTVVPGEIDEVSNRAFRRLAGYIFGGNTKAAGCSAKIEMTAPVAMEPTGDGWRMSFMIPSSWSMEELPTPDDPRVELGRDDGGLHAAVRFSGRWSPERFDEESRKLREWIGERGWRIAGDPVVARYDPPWTPWFLRHNEVLIRVEETGGATGSAS